MIFVDETSDIKNLPRCKVDIMVANLGEVIIIGLDYLLHFGIPGKTKEVKKVVMEAYPKIYLYKQIVHAKLFMDAHYNEPIGLDEIANEAYFSKFHFVRLFKSIYQITPHQYLIAVRIENAKIGLRQGLAIIDVCLAVGFDSASSFAGLFKRRVGQSPSEYQKEAIKRRREISDQPLRYVPNCFAESNGWTKNSNFKETRQKT